MSIHPRRDGIVQAVTHKFSYTGRNKKKLDWISGEAFLSETEGWILASKLNCSRFVLPYPTTFIIQRAKPFRGYVYGVRFSPHYMYWTDQDGRSKPLVKQRGRWSNQPVKILSIWKDIFTIKKVTLRKWFFVNLLRCCCSSSCTRQFHKEMRHYTWLQSWVWRIHQLCNTWSTLHCMTSCHSKLGMHLNDFLHTEQASTYHLPWSGLEF